MVALVWRGQPWYPVLLGMLYDFPQQLPWLSENIQSEPDGPFPPTSHLACLRQKVSGGNFSETAKDLFLAS